MTFNPFKEMDRRNSIRTLPPEPGSPQSLPLYMCTTGFGLDKFPYLESNSDESDYAGSDEEFDDFLLGIRDDGEFAFNAADSIKEAVADMKVKVNESEPFYEFSPLDSSVSCASKPLSPTYLELCEEENLDVEPTILAVGNKLNKIMFNNRGDMIYQEYDDSGRIINQRPLYQSPISTSQGIWEVSQGLQEELEIGKERCPTELADLQVKEVGLGDGEIPPASILVETDLGIPVPYSPFGGGPGCIKVTAGLQTEDIGSKFCLICGRLRAPTCLDVKQPGISDLPFPRPNRLVLNKETKSLEDKLFYRNVRSSWDAPSWYREITKHYQTRQQLARRNLLVISKSRVPFWGPLPELERDWKAICVKQTAKVRSEDLGLDLVKAELIDHPEAEVVYSGPKFWNRRAIPGKDCIQQAQEAMLLIDQLNRPVTVWFNASHISPSSSFSWEDTRPRRVRFEGTMNLLRPPEDSGEANR